MEEHRKIVVDVEKKIKNKIETGITKVLKDAEAEKVKFQHAVNNVTELS
jgi:hypothetical protein